MAPVQRGFSVFFCRLEELLATMRRDADLPPPRLRRRKYLSVALLVIDEMGFEAIGRHAASPFFRLLTYRDGRGSILITTDKSIREWPDLFAGNEVFAIAIFDRSCMTAMSSISRDEAISFATSNIRPLFSNGLPRNLLRSMRSPRTTARHVINRTSTYVPA